MKRCCILWYSARDQFYRKWYYFLQRWGSSTGNACFEVFMRFLQMLRQICYSVLLARHCVSFITAGQRNRDDFLCLIRLQSIQTHGPHSILVRKPWVKWIFGHWFNLRKKVNRWVNYNLTALCYESYNKFTTTLQTILELCKRVRVQWRSVRTLQCGRRHYDAVSVS